MKPCWNAENWDAENLVELFIFLAYYDEDDIEIFLTW